MTTPLETPPAKPPSAELQRLLVLADPLQGHPSEQAAAAASRALGLARAEACFVPHGAQAATWLCAQLFRQGLFQQVQVQARAVLHELQAPAMLDWRCEILRLAAMASCEAGELKAAFDTARALDEAASASGNDSWMLMAGYTLGACLDRIGDPWHASRVMKQAMDSHGAKAAPRQRLIGQIGLCAFSGDAFHRLRDAAPVEERLALLAEVRMHADRALALLPQAPEPLFEVAVHGNLGEVLLLQGELAAAESHLQRSLQRSQSVGLRMHHWRGQVTWAQWLTQSGRASEGLNVAQTVLAELAAMASTVAPVLALRAHDAAQAACAALGRYEEAYAHLVAFERLERRRTLAELRAQASLFVTRVEAQHSQRQAEQARFEALHQRQRAEQDPLTGLGNRAYLKRRVEELQAADMLQPAMMALIDIDHFKQINDEHGHAAGDAVLLALAAALREGLRESEPGGDVLARLGGEEFAVVLPRTDASRAWEICERLRHRVADCADWAELPRGRRVTISIGLASYGAASLEETIRQADAAMYAAKHAGRNRVSFGAGKEHPAPRTSG